MDQLALNQLAALRAIFKRLAKSDTPIKRKHARKAFDRAVKNIVSHVDAAYPSLRKDGTAIVQRKSRGAFCPLCRQPFKDYFLLATHLMKHGCRVGDCLCGKSGTPKDIARHLAGIKDIAAHFTVAILKESAHG